MRISQIDEYGLVTSGQKGRTIEKPQKQPRKSRMSLTEKDIFALLDYLSKPDQKTAIGFNRYSAAYLETNETFQEGYLSQMKGKRIFGVAASMDFCLLALSFGTEQFYGIDISIPTVLFGRLKIAAILALDLCSFNKFFIQRGFSSEDYYSGGVREELAAECRLFFDVFFNLELAKRKVWVGDITRRVVNVRNQIPDRYEQIQRAIRGRAIDVSVCNLFEGIWEIDLSEFNVLYFSNVLDYAQNFCNFFNRLHSHCFGNDPLIYFVLSSYSKNNKFFVDVSGHSKDGYSFVYLLRLSEIIRRIKPEQA